MDNPQQQQVCLESAERAVHNLPAEPAELVLPNVEIPLAQMEHSELVEMAHLHHQEVQVVVEVITVVEQVAQAVIQLQAAADQVGYLIH